MIKSIKLRFDKWKHTTAKAHLVIYKGNEVWLPKKLAWQFQIAGNDQHAWATIPAWLFEKITGKNAEEAYDELGEVGFRSCYGAIAQTIIEKHTPEKVAPVENNFIQELKK